jgi:hypothetical protein
MDVRYCVTCVQMRIRILKNRKRKKPNPLPSLSSHFGLRRGPAGRPPPPRVLRPLGTRGPRAPRAIPRAKSALRGPCGTFACARPQRSCRATDTLLLLKPPELLASATEKLFTTSLPCGVRPKHPPLESPSAPPPRK